MVLGTILITQYSCKEEVDEMFSVNDQPSIMRYLQDNEDVSLWAEIVKEAGLLNTFAVANEMTAFVPDNEAVKAFLKEKNVSEVADLDVEYLKKLVKYHTLATKFKHDAFGVGFIPDTTFTGAHLSTTFGDGGINSIYINKDAKIISKDIEVSNGYIHKINKVLHLVVETLEELYENDPNLTIFNQAMIKTGWKQRMINEKSKSSILSYTIFAVPDEVFIDNGINTYEELEAKFSDSDDVTLLTNGLNKYMAYHVIKNTYSFSDLTHFSSGQKTRNVLTLAKNQFISLTDEDNQLKINSNDGSYVSLLESKTDLIAVDGVYHYVNNLMEVFVPKASEFVWILATDIKELSQLPDYRNGVPRHKVPLEGQNIPGIEWEVSPMTPGAGAHYYQLGGYNKPTPYTDVFSTAPVTDFILFETNGRNGWVEFTTPLLLPGKYKVYVGCIRWPWRALTKSFIDGEPAANIDFGDYRWSMWDMHMGDVEWTETDQHKLRFVYLSRMHMMIHHFKFVPIEE
jgi:uncharacterized surface protein with fasciclin (FAS1) repeats